jgi:hypothetical protein
MNSIKLYQARIIADGDDDLEREILEEMLDNERECDGMEYDE